MSLANVGTEGAAALVTDKVKSSNLRVAELEVVITLSICTKRGVIFMWRQIDRSTALPASDHAGTSEVRGAIHRVCCEEAVELGDELLELTEGEEGAVLRPRGASDAVPSLTG